MFMHGLWIQKNQGVTSPKCVPNARKSQDSKHQSKERFSDQEAPNEKMGDLILKYILRKYRVKASFMSKEEELWGAGFVKL